MREGEGSELIGSPGAPALLTDMVKWDGMEPRGRIMVQTRNEIKRAKTATVESALFNNDILLSIAPFLECTDLVSLALTSRNLGVAVVGGDND